MYLHSVQRSINWVVDLQRVITIYHVVQCLYKVEITTGGMQYAGTDDDIYIKLSKDGYFIYLNNEDNDDFEQGKYVNI